MPIHHIVMWHPPMATPVESPTDVCDMLCSIQDVFDVTKQLLNQATHSMVLVPPLTGHIVIFKPSGLISNPIVAAIRNGSTTSWDKTKQIWKL